MNIPQPPINGPIIGTVMCLPAWASFFGQIARYLGAIPRSDQALENYADDTAASAGGIPLYGYYRNGSIVMQRVV